MMHESCPSREPARAFHRQVRVLASGLDRSYLDQCGDCLLGPRASRNVGSFPIGREVECGQLHIHAELSSGVDLSAFERLLTDISTRFINAAPANVDAEITGALRSLVEFLGVDRSTLFQWSADGRNLENTHHWVVEGCEPFPRSSRRGLAVFLSQDPRGQPLLVLEPC